MVSFDVSGDGGLQCKVSISENREPTDVKRAHHRQKADFFVEILLKILGITNTEIARRAGTTRQAVAPSLRTGTGLPFVTALSMVEEAARDGRKLKRAGEAREWLDWFEARVYPG